MSINECEKCREHADDGLVVDENGFYVCRDCSVKHTLCQKCFKPSELDAPYCNECISAEDLRLS